MGKKSEPTITKCKNSENWTMVSFKPDLAKFGMKCLEDDTVALMKRRVIDLAGCLGKGVKVELDGTRVPPKTFEDYVKLYLGTSTDTTRIYEKVNDRWEVCVSLADGHFEQLRNLRKGKLNIPKLEDANLAASANSGDCTLILTEGDSAKALAMSGLSVVGQDYYGVFPLKGKLLNVREATPKQLQENAEIQNIKKILGLQHGKNYENVKELRYGHLMIMADQDHDGSHIKGLLINFIHSFWPSLLKVPNFMLEFITPIVKATNKKTKKVLSFYTMPEYEAWKESLGNKATKYKIKYYKGLGTSESKEGAEYFADLDHHMKDFVWADDKDGDAIELAFSKKKIDAKERLEHFSWTNFDSKEKHIQYRDFINKELILFSMADLQRSIPSMVDGLKPGQRKILFCAFKKPIIQEIKVAQFSGYVSEHSAYHHGEASLVGTIIGMAQIYVGSNNINLLQPNGQFGTHQMGGKDHASGKDHDELLLNYLNDDGQSIEPAW
ncbi:DNA topoisomerase 2 [Tanacetum coccineum]